MVGLDEANLCCPISVRDHGEVRVVELYNILYSIIRVMHASGSRRYHTLEVEVYGVQVVPIYAKGVASERRH